MSKYCRKWKRRSKDRNFFKLYICVIGQFFLKLNMKTWWKHWYYICLLALCQWKKEKIWWRISGTRSLVISWRKFDRKYKKEQCSYDLEWPWMTLKTPFRFSSPKRSLIFTKQHFFPYNTRRTLYRVKRKNMPQITMKFLSLPSITNTSKNLSLLALRDSSE